MRYIQFLYFLIIILYFESCNSSNEVNSEVLKNSEQTFHKSLSTIEEMTSFQMHNLDSKKNDPMWIERAKPRFQIALQIWNTSDSLINLIEKAKTVSAINEDSIYERIYAHSSFLKTLDSSMYKEFKKSIDSLPFLFEKEKMHTFSKEIRLCIYSKLQVEIAILENSLIMYCNANTSGYREGYSFITPIINQNISHLRPFEELEVSVGLGYLNYPYYPRIFVNGDSLSYKDGMYRYKMLVSDRKGKYKIPIKVEYFDEFEGLVIIKKEITYYVE